MKESVSFSQRVLRSVNYSCILLVCMCVCVCSDMHNELYGLCKKVEAIRHLRLQTGDRGRHPKRLRSSDTCVLCRKCVWRVKKRGSCMACIRRQ